MKHAKALKEIRRLARIVQCDLTDVLEYGSMDKVEEEKEALKSIQIKVQAILRRACEALETNDV